MPVFRLSEASLSHLNANSSLINTHAKIVIYIFFKLCQLHQKRANHKLFLIIKELQGHLVFTFQFKNYIKKKQLLFICVHSLFLRDTEPIEDSRIGLGDFFLEKILNCFYIYRYVFKLSYAFMNALMCKCTFCIRFKLIS